MCGIVGCYGSIGNEEKRVFSSLLYFDAYRGIDSTGVCVVESAWGNNNPIKAHVFKEIGGPWNLFAKHPKFDRKGDDIKVYGVHGMIGHNRAATWGKVTEDNAHPFEIGDIVGVHNGTLNDWSLKGLPGHGEYEVDSQVLIRRINDEGPEQAYKDISGAMAVVYYDKEFDTIGIFRNSQRPLWCVWSEDKKTLFWASEEWMLFAASARCNYKFHMEGTKYFKPDHLYLLDRDGAGPVVFGDIVKLEPCNKARPIPANTNNNKRWNYGDSYWGKDRKNNSSPVVAGPNKPRPATPGQPTKKVESNDGVAHYQIKQVEESDDFARGFANHILTRKMFENVMEQNGGCSYCKKRIAWADKNDVVWHSPHEPVCKDCEDVHNNLEEKKAG